MPAASRAARTDCDALYRRHAAGIYRYVYGALRNRADAEDVTQQTFLNAYRAISRGTNPLKAEHWLLAIAHNEIRRYFRQTRGQPLEVQLDDDVPDFPPERDDPSVEDVVHALQQLPHTQRSALVMRELEGRSYAEIAKILDVTESALETLMFRARRGLAEALYGELTCADAEDAVSRRSNGQLLSRESRRLSAHLRKCPSCKRLARARGRAGSLLSGLTLWPFPASGLGGSAATTGGAAAVAGGGITAVGSAFAVKAAALTAAVGIAGGVGYTVADHNQVVKTPPNATRVVAAPRARPAYRSVATAVAKRRSNGGRLDRRRNARVGGKPKPSAEVARDRGPVVTQVAKPRKTHPASRNTRSLLPRRERVPRAHRTKPKPKPIRSVKVVEKSVRPAKPRHHDKASTAKTADKAKTPRNEQPSALVPPSPPGRGPKK